MYKPRSGGVLDSAATMSAPPTIRAGDQMIMSTEYRSKYDDVDSLIENESNNIQPASRLAPCRMTRSKDNAAMGT
jgi:hypothetical protein